MYNNRQNFDYLKLGKKIKEARKKKKYTQEILADKTGLSPKYISAVERGIKHVSFPTLIDIANCLEMDSTELTYPWLYKIGVEPYKPFGDQYNRLTPNQKIMLDTTVKDLLTLLSSVNEI